MSTARATTATTESLAATVNSVAAENTTLINLLLGGLSIIVMVACWAFIDKSISVYTVSQLAVTLAFIVNHPHFAASYMLLYSDFRKNISFKNIKYIWSAIVVPVILFSYLFYCIAAERADLMGHSINAMFFLVGWHYVKQIFGVIIVTSSLKKLFYTQIERNIILMNLFALWGISFFGSQTYVGSFQFYGISYNSIGFDKLWLNLCYSVFTASGIYMLGLHLKRYIDTGSLPTSSAIVAMGSLYVWYLPVFNHPHFAYLIPFFHSLQYLVFVWYFKKNQVNGKIAAAAIKTDAEKRKEWLIKFGGYLAVSLILGFLMFEFVPKGMDKYIKFDNTAMGTNPILVGFLLFINIHHYFIDNTVWKSSNDEIRRYLFLNNK